METFPSSTNIAGEIKQSLIKKALTIIARRQILFKNMNLYSLDQLSKVIQQINQQQVLSIKSTTIPETDDLTPFSFDNMMSASQVKLIPHQTQIQQHNASQTQSKSNQLTKKIQQKIKKKDKLTIIDLLEDDTASRDYRTTCYSINKQQKIQESAQIQAFRIVKQRENQQKLKKKHSEQKKKLAIPINLNKERVMYGYDSKVMRLQKMRQKQNHSIYKMNSSLIHLQQDQKRKPIIQFSNNKTPINISNKINITQKQADQQRERQMDKKARRQYKTIIQSPTLNIRVNPQSHKQIQNAITIKEPGVKISIEKRLFSADQTNNSMGNRKLTRSQYLQIKSNENLKQIYFRNPNISIIDRLKFNPEKRVKTQYGKEQTSSSHFNSGKKIKLSLNTSYADSKRDKSKILTHSLQAKAQLLNQVKDRAAILQTIDDSLSSKQQTLSSVDKYNLLYLKYKGNPPKITDDKLFTEQQQSRINKEGKSPLLKYSKNMNRQNKLIQKIS